MAETNYTKFRGKCEDMSEALCEKDKSLTLVRGYYHCPLWGKQSQMGDVNTKVVCETEEESLTCKNMKEYGDSMDCERYKCTVCGRRTKLDYDEMR